MKSAKGDYNKTLIFAASGMGMMIFGIVLVSLGSILPDLREKFGLSELSTGSLLTTLPFGILLGSITFGPIVDRYGYKLLLATCGILIFAGLEGIALSSDIKVIWISVFMIGAGGGAINGGTNALVSDTSTGDRGASLSLLGVFFGVGALGVPLLLGLLVNHLAYEKILMWIGLCLLFPTAFFLLIYYPLPKQPQGFPIQGALRLMKDPLILLMGIVLFFQSGVEGVATNWTTTFLEEEKGLLSNNALFSLTCFVIGMTLMRLILGWALNRLKPQPVLIVSVGVSITASLMVYFSDTQIVTFLGITLLGMGLAACFPVIMGFTGTIYSHLSGTAFSCILAIALIGNMLCNYGMGAIAEALSTGKLPVVLVGLLILQLITLILLLKQLTGKISFINKTKT